MLGLSSGSYLPSTPIKGTIQSLRTQCVDIWEWNMGNEGSKSAESTAYEVDVEG